MHIYTDLYGPQRHVLFVKYFADCWIKYKFVFTVQNSYAYWNPKFSQEHNAQFHQYIRTWVDGKVKKNVRVNSSARPRITKSTATHIKCWQACLLTTRARAACPFELLHYWLYTFSCVVISLTIISADSGEVNMPTTFRRGRFAIAKVTTKIPLKHCPIFATLAKKKKKNVSYVSWNRVVPVSAAVKRHWVRLSGTLVKNQSVAFKSSNVMANQPYTVS